MKWGLRSELLIILLFIVCLLIATFGLSELGLLSNDSDIIYTGRSANDNFDYTTLENKIAASGKRYFEITSAGVYEHRYVSVRELVKSGYISQPVDAAGRKCTGYAEITSGNIVFGYVKCPGYLSTGYSGLYD